MPRVPVPAWSRSRVVLCLLFCSTFCFSFGLGLVFPTLASAEGHLQIGQDARVASDLLLRAAPGYDATVIIPVAVGTTVRVLDGPVTGSDGSLWYGVAVSGDEGFLPGGALTALAGSTEADDADDLDVSAAAQDNSSGSPVEAAVVGETAIVTTALNLRAGPSTSDAVLLVMPGGASVTLTGNSVNGFVSVDYHGTRGWAYQSYLDTSGAPSQPAPTPSSGAAAVTTADLNLRGSASLSASVLLVMPAGATVAITGSAQNGFYPVTYGGQAGWAYADYLRSGSSGDDGGSSGDTGTARVTEALNLRSGPSTTDGIITVMPAGATVTLAGNSANGFLSVSYNGTTGWAYAAYLETGGSSPSPTPTPDLDPGAGTGMARVTVALNLRTGPSTADGILTVMPSGATVTLTGNRANGFLSVSYNGMAGWAYATYLETGSSSPSPAVPSDPDSGGQTGAARTMTALNLRAGPSTSDTVLLVIPGGAGVTLTGSSANGFSSVSYNGVAGWAYASYLDTDSNSSPDPAPGGGGGSGIAWPVQGGTWQIIQGYNGGTHQNRSASAQYYYSLDIARTDGNTAGQSVLSPVSGTIRWVHPASGGIAIDMGNGYILAMFHCTFAGSLGSGQTVQQGQYLGTISGPGGPGYAGTPHIDLTLWRSSDGGSSRSSSPFSGTHGISGLSFPDIGGWNQHYGFQFNP